MRINAVTRRTFLACAAAAPSIASYKLSLSDDDFLEDLSRRAFQFFWE
jgi:hypothetical protein